jgi:Icc-related predicted phosphoesterase
MNKMNFLPKKNLETNTYINYIEYINPLPKTPTPKQKISIVMISDLHNNQKLLNLPEADILLVAGDMTNLGSYQELTSFSQFLSKVKPKFDLIIVIAGNHEVTMDIDSFPFLGGKYFKKDSINAAKAKSIITENKDIIYLEDSGYEYKGVKIWGTPWVNPCGDWGFCLDKPGQDELIFNKIPSDTDILVSHSPPFKILDAVPVYSYSRDPETNLLRKDCEIDNTGNKVLLKRVKEVRPKLHVFGHIHECSGAVVEDGILFVNASIMNHRHKPTNLPKRVVLDF